MSDIYPDSNLSTIHVPSGPTSVSHAQTDLTALTLPELIARKDTLEAELKALGAVLDSHGVTMQSSLTTFDGFPRADIDVAQVRVTRARVIWLRNDWKGVMGAIERGLHELHARKAQGQGQEGENEVVGQSETARAVVGAEAGSASASTSTSQPPSAPEAPFARINTVEAGSPANEAGLKVGDLVTRFGEAIWSNHERLRKVGEVVQENQGRPILVRVVREVGAETREIEVRVTPRFGWGGRGSLGCHILPI